VQCPCCERRWASFAPDWNRPDAICPGCGAHERHRALWIYLRDEMTVGERPIDMLHFAPEYALDLNLAPLRNLRRTTADLDGAGVDMAVDITAMPFADQSFEAVICSHVLEHVPDDRAAMAELLRVLRPGGWALVMVPIDKSLEGTYENAAIVTPEAREEAFWQHDHVRLYAPDIAGRLEEAGFHIEPVRIAEGLEPGVAQRYGLLCDETVFHCVRPALS